MVRQIGMGYGIWESLAHLAGNRLGGHEKVWVTGVYGLSQVWIKTEATVLHHPGLLYTPVASLSLAQCQTTKHLPEHPMKSSVPSGPYPSV